MVTGAGNAAAYRPPRNDLFVAKVRPLFPLLLSAVTPAIPPFGFGRMRDQQGAVLFSGVPGREWP